MSNSELNKIEPSNSNQSNNPNANTTLKNDVQIVRPQTESNKTSDTIQSSLKSEFKIESVDSTPQRPLKNQPESKSEFVAIDTVIAGKVYTINCPAGEENELKIASNQINEFISGLRQQAPNLSHENLLVLCCLNLFEQLQQSNKEGSNEKEINRQANYLIDKMIKGLKD